ncbi:MAG: ABC transporter substrate-binding protein [Myxococcales bacterium]|nr:ABC transporter substrate-binding protein [Myxococcales bacterium]
MLRNALATLVLVLATVAACDKPAPKAGGAARIVTLTPSATELVAALGAAEALVGVDEYSTYPPAVAALPKVGSFVAPNFEAIVALRPTLVVADDIHDDAAAALTGAGVPVVRLPMHALPDVEGALATLGERLGRTAEAAARREEMAAAKAAAGKRHVGRGHTVLIVIDRAPGGLDGMIAAANGTWLDELVAMTGAGNVLAGAATRYPKLSAEEIVRTAPDTILDVSYAADPATAAREWASRPELASVPAITQGRVRVLKAPYFLAPSPRMAAALTELEAALGP